MYHLQMGEGNLINNLKLGLSKGWIQFVEIADVPGRKEPGTGEINYQNIFARCERQITADTSAWSTVRRPRLNTP